MEGSALPCAPVAELASPVVRRAACFYINDCFGVVGDKMPRLHRAYSLIYLGLAVFIGERDLEDVFAQVYRYGGSILHGMAPLFVVTFHFNGLSV